MSDYGTGLADGTETPPELSSGAPVFDRAALLDRVDGDEELLGELLAIFLEQTVADLDALKQAAEGGSAEDAHRGAHSIKGAAANMGAMAVSHAAREAEEAARNNDLARVQDALITVIEQEFERFRQHVQADVV